MPLHRKRDGTYEGRYYRDGTKQSPRIRENFGKIEPQEARELYKQRLAEAARRRARGGHLTTFRAAWFSYSAAHSVNLSSKGARRKRYNIEAFILPRFGDERLATIQAADIEIEMAKWVESGVSKATANRRWNDMRAVMRFAKRKLGAEVPALGNVDAFKLANRGAKTAFVEGVDWRKIVAAFDDEEAWKDFTRDRRRLGKERKQAYLENLRAELPKIEALLYSGQRLGDVLDLEIEAANFERNEITWRQAKSGGKPVVVPMGSRMREIVANAIGGRTKGKVWGSGDSPAAQRRVQRALSVACTMAGVKRITPHVLRKTLASWLAIDGESLRTIQEILGDADPVITARHYAHLTPKGLRSAIAKVERIAKGKGAAKGAGRHERQQKATNRATLTKAQKRA